MSEGFARVLSIVSIVFTVASLALAIVFARRKTRIRVGFDLARAIIAVAAILVMAAVTSVFTSNLAVALAVLSGLALGFGQGSKLEITEDEKGFHARRSPVAIALWGAGIVIMQAAGIAARSGVVRLGQTVAWFSACLGIGLMAGRTGPIKRTAGVGVAVMVPLAVSMALLIGEPVSPVAAQTVQLTDSDLCDLTPGDWSWSQGVNGADSVLYQYLDTGVSFNPTVPSAVAGCANNAQHDPGGGFVDVGIYLLPSPQMAMSEAQRIAASAQGIARDVYLTDADYRNSPYYCVTCERERLQMDFARIIWDYKSVYLGWMGPFLIVGSAEDDNSRGEAGDSVDFMIQRMNETAYNVEPLLAGTAPTDTALPPDENADGVTGVDGSVPGSSGVGDGPSGPDSSSGGPIDDSASARSSSDDEPIDPEDAARQAVAGLIAAVAIGLISWGEATAEIATILSGRPGGGGVAKTVPTDFIDPYDQTPLAADPTTGMVWWPWDGSGGHWVNPSEVPTLLHDWNRELDSETARRVAGHNAQAERDWQATLDRIRRSDLEDARRRAAETAGTDAFDRYVASARSWMEKADANSLGILDRITGRVAAQGFATDADIAEARRIANDSRIYWDTMQRMNEEDWVRINQNHAAIVETGSKIIAGIIDPTKGVVSGAIFGGAEAIYDGKSATAVVGNAAWGAGLGRISAAVGSWAPGKEAMGTIAWGAGSGSLTSAGTVLVSGGTWDQAWDAGKIGFVSGGMGGIVERINTITQPPPPNLPTITSRPGGPRVGYDTPFNPRLRPPERGGIGAMPDRVPTIQVRSGGPRPHYDQPLNPRHVDPNDPRYVPPGTPADQVHTAPSDFSKPPSKIIEESLGGRPPSSPPEVSPAEAFDPPPPVDVPEQPPPVTPSFDDGPGGGATAPHGRADTPDLPGNWGTHPNEYLGGMDAGPSGPRPPVDLPEPSSVDAFGKPPLGELPPTVRDQARSTMPGGDIVDRMMKQPSDLAGTPAARATTFGASGRLGGFDTDTRGRVIVNGRHIGNIDPDTGVIKNLADNRITIAADDTSAIGYLEHPDAPPGLTPAYDQRGQLVGHVDAAGRAIVNGELRTVAIDADGNFVPYDPPPAPVAPSAPDPPTIVRTMPGIGDEPPVTGARPGAGRVEIEPPTGELGPPPSTGVGSATDPAAAPADALRSSTPIDTSGTNIKPRIPVLDEDGTPTHFVEPGPREIRYDGDGNPMFVQRQFPATPAIVRGGGISAPVPEVYDSSVTTHPLTGDGAPPSAPSVGSQDTPGGETL